MNAYSQDLRQRVFSYSLSHSVRATARLFRVSPTTVQRWRQLFVATGARADGAHPPADYFARGRVLF